MLDKSIDGALLALRKQIIRGKLDGLDHVEALLVMRGVDMPKVMPAKNADVALRGHARALLAQALREQGPMNRREIVAYVCEERPELPYKVVYARTDRLLWKMRMAGLIAKEFGPDGCLWRSICQ